MLRSLLVTLLTALAMSLSLHAAAAVDANRANQAELETVKGIGPGLSAKIIKARETGTFKNWADLVERVPGLGRGNAAKMSQAGLVVAGATFDAGALPVAAKRERKAASGATERAPRRAMTKPAAPTTP